jgi:hypothetical protein
LQFAQDIVKTKNCKRACFASADKNCFKKIPQLFKKIKIHRHLDHQRQQTLTRRLNIDKAYNNTVDRSSDGKGKGGFRKFAVHWLIEHSNSHEHL